MRIALVVETYARDMGYINNTLPKFLARLGQDVHVLTTDLAPYHQIGSAREVFGDEFADRNRNVPGQRERIDGYHVHTLRHRKSFGYAKPMGLKEELERLQPDVVCIFQAAGWIPLLCATAQGRLGYALVIGSHMGKTVFSLAGSPLRRLRSFMLRTMPGWYIASRTELCVVPTQDCADVVAAHFGVPRRKVEVMYLPVDTDYFYPNGRPGASAADEARGRTQLRAALGFADDEVVCVYSGKLNSDKNALVLAKSVASMRATGLRVRALFIGAGEQAATIRAVDGATVLPFMPIEQLGHHYRACDIGVWMNETVSFLDGACCGLPLLLSDVVKDISHLREFVSIYEAGNPRSLARAIESLLDPAERTRRSQLAANLGLERFGAMNYAQRRMVQFSRLSRPRHSVASRS